MTIRTFAEQHQLKIAKDECGDEIIRGRRGHLYFDCGDLCLMVCDGQLAHRSKWEALKGKYLWLGEISQGIQDVWIRGIPLGNARQAIKMCRIRPAHVVTPGRAAVLVGLALSGKSTRYGQGKQSRDVESPAKPKPVPD